MARGVNDKVALPDPLVDMEGLSDGARAAFYKGMRDFGKDVIEEASHLEVRQRGAAKDPEYISRHFEDAIDAVRSRGVIKQHRRNPAWIVGKVAQYVLTIVVGVSASGFPDGAAIVIFTGTAVAALAIYVVMEVMEWRR